MSGQDVAVVQAWLGRAGYPVATSGYFGPATAGALERFQAAHGLTADGVAGRRTLAALGGHDPSVRRTAVTARGSRGWLATIPGTGGIRVDSRILPDVESLIVYYDLRITSGYSPAGHARYGEHPLGLAVDAVPADGNWRRTAQLAGDLGWQSSCGWIGCGDRLRAPFRFIGYNGYPNHGDPAHAGASAHIHLSWEHAVAAPNTRALWVQVLSPR